MLAKELIKILQQNPEAEVHIGEYVTEYVSNVEEVKQCNVEEDNGVFTCEAFVLIQGKEILVYSDSKKFPTE